MNVITAKRKRKPYNFAVGRRKTSTARVRFMKSDEKEGSVEVNGKASNEYFAHGLREIVIAPIELVSAKLGGYFTVKVSGGGSRSQAEAIRHGITRLLVEINEDWKPVLKSKGYLTRDPRMKERKKPGLKRARRAPQWSKR